MKTIGLALFVAVIGFPLAIAQDVGAPTRTIPSAIPVSSTADTAGAIAKAYGRLPLAFGANVGQFDPEVDYVARGPGYTLFLSESDAVLVLRSRSGRSDLRMQLVNSGTSRGEGRDALAGKVHSFIGDDPARWRTDIPTYRRVVYPTVYPGIDLVYHGDQGALEYDFVVGPGADPGAIAIQYAGVHEQELTADGELVLRAGAGEIRQRRPVAYQIVGGQRQERAVRYRMSENRTVSFEVGDYEHRLPLVIDPVLAYATYLGGSFVDEAAAIAVDAAGQAYVVGHSSSADFPTTTGALQADYAGIRDIVVSKLSPLGDALLYSTYIGGSLDDAGLGVVIDAAGNAFIDGQTASGNFPTTGGALQMNHGGGEYDAFVLKLNPLGNALVYSTYLGGSANDTGANAGIKIDSTGNAYVTGFTESSNFPTTLGAFQATKAGQADGFISKLNPLGTSLIYSTFIGGSALDYGSGLGLDSTGNVTIVGVTHSTNLPTLAAFQPAYGGGPSDGFVAKLNPLGSALVYSTYLGGSDEDNGVGSAVDAAGNTYALIETYSTDLTTASAFQSSNGGQLDAFIAKVNPLGGRVYATYLGGSRDDDGFAIAVDASGDAHVTGATYSDDFPIVDAFQATRAGSQEVFVTKFAPTGSALLFSTYLGSNQDEFGAAIAVGASADIYIAGATRSIDFPVTLGAFQTTYGGVQDGFAAKIGLLPSTASCEVTMNEGGWITAANGDMATFNGVVQTDPQGSPSGHESYNDHGPVQPMAVDSVSILAVTCSDDRTTASIFGNATIDGTGNHAFRIDMVDGSLSGSADRYGITLDNGYSSGLQPLGGGNINIH